MNYFKTIILICIAIMSLETYSQIPQTNNLISYYPFLGNLEDQSGKNHNTGSINGDPSLTQNRFGTNNAAYYLDGTDDYLYFGNSIYADLPDTDSDGYYEDDYTISIWAKSSVVDNEIFIAFGEADGLYTVMISVIGSTIGFNSSNWGFPSTSTSGKKSDNNWHQYTFVYVAGSFRKLFIDGSLVRQANDSQRRFNFKNYGLSVGIGRFDATGNPEGLATTYTGSVDDVRMWNVALTNTEVSNLYTYENNPANDFSLSPSTPFVTTWQTDGSTRVTIPLTGGNYDFTIDWGDGTTEIKTGAPGNLSHTYSTAGVKTVSITPNITTGFPRIYINNFGNRNLLQTIESWGSGQWGASVDRAFYGAANLEVNATDMPDFSATTNFQYMFLNCSSVTGTNGFANWTLNTNPTATISFSNMFKSTTLFNGDISNWDVSRVNTFDNMFNNAASFNQNIGSWNVANVTNMSNMFNNARVFAQDISGWNVGNVTNMASMFQNADAFNIDISSWNVSNVTNMSSMFAYNNIFNQDVSNWDVSSVTNMTYMFQTASVFNSPLNWGVKTGNVTNMQRMFAEAPQFNKDIDGWDVSKVTNTNLMFYRANSFNQSLNSWNVGNLIDPRQMFQECTSFNGDISSWVFTTDPAKNVNASSMFQNATAFNQNISNWNTERFTSMASMFLNATSFNQNIGSWNVANVTNMSNMFNNARVFAQDISGWNVGNVTNMASMFQNADAFNIDISSWNVSNVTNMSSMFAYNNIFNQDVSNWDVSSVTNMTYMFQTASVFNSPLNWGSKTGNVTNMVRMFAQAPQFNQDIDGWDVSKVTSTNLMFYRTNSFNQSLNSWNVGNLIDPRQMFQECTSFNGDISSWVFTTDPAKTINAASMFQSATAFNQDISNWNVERFTNMAAMFRSATSFNQNIGSWNVANVINMSSMFDNANSFTFNIGNWNVGNVTNMSSMFQNADAFNIDISGWNVSKVTSMANMFNANNVFNQDLSNWNVSSVTNMEGMFRQMPLFNAALNWGTKTGNVTNMRYMFYATPLFNQNINSWNVSKVTNFRQMFHDATNFNQSLTNWQFNNESNKTIDMDYMFYNATSFNQDIGTWNISRVTKLYFFLAGGKLSRANYDALLLGWSTLDAGESQVPINLNAHFGSSKYSDTAAVLAARNTTLIANKNWTITDGGMDADVILPEIASNALASDNTTINITFSENVYRTDVSSGVLETTDFLFSLSGGTATLNSSIPNSITTTTNLTFELGLDINGTPDGTEVLTVTPVLNAIFDSSGNAATTTQSNNTAQLNDVTVPVITGPSSETGVNSAISLHENIASVFTFSANETVSWALSNTNDESLFNIDSNGNLVFTTAPDYETPLSTLNSNTYVVEVIATDTASNTNTQTLTISILDIANSTFGTFAPITKNYFTGTHTIAPPTTNNTNPIIYTSDNTAVATISGSVIMFTGVGTANITATQAADANYEGNSVSALLTVIGKDLVSKYGGISSTDVNYISATGTVGGSLGLDKYGKQEYVLGDIVSSGLVMHLDAGNMSSYPGYGTAWTDISGNSNHGTLQNGVAFTSVNDGAMVFDGVNDYFVTNNNLDLSNTDKLTIQIILKTASSSSEMVMEHSTDWNSYNAFGIISNNLSNKMQITDHNQGYNVSNSVASINNNNWHLFTATTDRSLNAADQNLIYIDGNTANKVNVANLINDNNGNFTSHKLYISTRAGSSLYFNGTIAQVLIYNRVLTAAEIEKNYNAIKLKYGL
ncbi:BspA family leucine-rich repeat surface protein [uncultured Winogradskyella sp.]|uniref:BspA family leucine-rich repeat surface protein n=1 Tax=uncultured Winogradskyella sp. TaxID=395353 RepID=UPI0030D913A9